MSVSRQRSFKATLFFAFLLSANVGNGFENYTLNYSSYLGSGYADSELIELAEDNENSLYIAGTVADTSKLPVLSGGFGDPNYSFQQGFIQKYSNEGELVYTAFLQDAEITGIEIDASGRAYLTGSHHGVGDSPYCSHWGAFIARLSADGSKLEFCSEITTVNPGLRPNDIALDKDGNVYVTGKYAGQDIPVSTGAFQTSPAGAYDAYVVKLNADGTQVLTAFYLGGADRDEGTAIDVGEDGTIFVAGNTESLDFPAPNAPSGAVDAFLAKVSNDGTVMKSSTLHGGSGYDYVSDLVVDGLGNAYMAGYTTSSDYPTTTGAIQPDLIEDRSGLIVKVTNSDLVEFSTLFGAGANIVAIDIDSNGNIYATGNVGSPNFITTQNALQQIYPVTLRNAFFSKINSAGTEVLYSSFFGRNNPAVGLSIEALTGGFAILRRTNGEVVLAGSTNSKDLPVSGNASQKTLKGRNDLFVAKFEISPLNIMTPLLLDPITLDEPYNYTLSVEGGEPPYEWFSEEQYILNSLELFSYGLINGTLVQPMYDTIYHYSDPVSFLPLLIGIRDSAGNVFHKEFLMRYNYRPSADAGSRKSEIGGRQIVLDGTDSYDHEGGIISYQWSQLSGPEVILKDATSAVASFIAPEQDTLLTFQLTVTDTDGVQSNPDIVEVRVYSPIDEESGGGGMVNHLFVLTVFFLVYFSRIFGVRVFGVKIFGVRV